jgi:hypothetical protein
MILVLGDFGTHFVHLNHQFQKIIMSDDEYTSLRTFTHGDFSTEMLKYRHQQNNDLFTFLHSETTNQYGNQQHFYE